MDSNNVTSSPIILPSITIQHDFPSVITDVREGTVPSEEFWISCYKLQEHSVHGKTLVELDDTDRNQINLKSREGVEIHGKVYTIRANSS